MLHAEKKTSAPLPDWTFFFIYLAAFFPRIPRADLTREERRVCFVSNDTIYHARVCRIPIYFAGPTR